ncbi:hypothetical protein C4577_07435 [Candidatus Parcubacteria bacterium]|nr:MAG: hypothetical protein C4577_07435 [Candidatus Parcubacteria bacterium]
MLTKIKAKNFQSLEEIEVDLNHPVTVFCGKTGSGKSSLLRALRWIVLNLQPQKVNFVKRGKKTFAVELEVDGNLINRTKPDNVYRLNGSEYKAFGTKIPEDIDKILNVDKLNFSHQLDGPFWFDLSPGQVSKELNSIINLEVIDSSLSKAKSSITSSKKESEVCQNRLKEAKAKKKSLLWVKELNIDLKKLEEMKSEIMELSVQASRISELIKAGANAAIKVQTLSQAFLDCEEALSKYPLDLINKVKKLQSLLQESEAAKKRLDEAEKSEKEAQSKLDEIKGVSCPTCGKEMNSDEYDNHEEE